MSEERPVSGETLQWFEVEKLRSEHRHITGLLQFIQELTVSVLRAKTVAELFDVAFRKLSERVDFDLAVSLMVEQNLDLYVTKRPECDRAVNDRLVAGVRQTLQSLIPMSFTTTDVVIQSDTTSLPPRPAAAEADPLQHQMHTALHEGSRTAGILVLYRGGEPFPFEEQQVLEIVSSQIGMVLENIRVHARIQNLADTDDLTGIWNRRYFRRQLPSEIERARIYSVPLSLLMFDVDDFKTVNDRYGHTTADVLLSELCGTVRDSLRPPDLFARFGGDEFAVILPHTDLHGAISVAERIVTRVRNIKVPAFEDDLWVGCTISVGVACYIPPDESAPSLTRRADEQLYLAKRHGKNRYSY